MGWELVEYTNCKLLIRAALKSAAQICAKQQRGALGHGFKCRNETRQAGMPGHRDVILKGKPGNYRCSWMLVSTQLPGGCLQLHVSYAQLPPLHPCLHIFCVPFECLSLKTWPWCPQTQAVPEVLSWTPSRHWGFKEVKGLFSLILLTHCLTRNWCFAAEEFSSSEYFPWKFWHAAGEPCSKGRGDVCLPYRKETQRKGIKWGWSLRSCQIKKMEGNTGGWAKGLYFAVKQPDICSGFKSLWSVVKYPLDFTVSSSAAQWVCGWAGRRKVCGFIHPPFCCPPCRAHPWNALPEKQCPWFEKFCRKSPQQEANTMHTWCKICSGRRKSHQ